MHTYPSEFDHRNLTTKLLAKLNEQQVGDLKETTLQRAVSGCVAAPALTRLITTLLGDGRLVINDGAVSLRPD